MRLASVSGVYSSADSKADVDTVGPQVGPAPLAFGEHPKFTSFLIRKTLCLRQQEADVRLCRKYLCPRCGTHISPSVKVCIIQAHLRHLLRRSARLTVHPMDDKR